MPRRSPDPAGRAQREAPTEGAGSTEATAIGGAPRVAVPQSAFGERVRHVLAGGHVTFVAPEDPSAQLRLVSVADAQTAPYECARTGADHPVLVIAIDQSGTAGARIAALRAGVFDCVSEPIDAVELALRIRNAARFEARELVYGNLRLDRRDRSLSCGRRVIDLSPTEFALLHALMEQPGRILGRSELYWRGWGYTFDGRANPLGTYIGYLRRKLRDGGATVGIATIRSRGYCLSASTPSAVASQDRAAVHEH